MIELKNKKIGLVLSGGGAKGAYQVGMFRALEELGIAGNIKAISGCSIGAYAAAIYPILGNGAYRDFLYNFFEMFKDGEAISEELSEQAKHDVADGKVSLKQYISERRFWRYEGRALRRYVQGLLAGGALERAGIRTHICAYSVDKEKPDYFDLFKLSDEDKARAVVGSGSLQFLLEPMLLQGSYYLDGGVIPEICKNPAPADKIPLLPLLKEDVDFILVNFLIASDSVNSELVPEGTGYLELRPSSPLESYPGAGTLDFSPEKLRSHEKTGYRDTMKLIKENCII